MDSILELWQGLPANLQELTIRWGGTFIRLILIFVLAKLSMRFGYSVIGHFFPPKKGITLGERTETFSGLAKSVIRYLIIFVAMLMILREFVDITPILAGAGILGLAVGFGAQSLVRDIITGFFIIIEEQFSVGDHITIDSRSGIVEQVGLRVTKIRDFGGEQYIFPNSKIEIVTNHSHGPQRALIEISVAYEEDVEHVLQVLKDLCEKISGDYPEIVEGPNVLGVTDLDDSAVMIRIMAKVQPLQQWYIERELRKAVKIHFDKLGIEIPYPRRVVYSRIETKKEEEKGI